MKTLKGNHFSNYLFSLMMTTYNDIMSNQKREMLNYKLTQEKKENKKNNKTQKNPNNYNPRKFKSPKLLDYHFKYKAPQFSKLNKRNFLNDNEKASENYSLNIFTNRTKKEAKKEKHQKDFEYNAKYDPIKISNNFLQFNASKEYSKLSEKLEIMNNKENIKEINNKGKIKLMKNDIKNAIIEGYFGRRAKSDVPYLFDISTTFYNNYSNKSEKERHEVILNEINKLKAFLYSDPKNKIQIFKNFLIKFSYKDIDQLSDEQILSICDFICINDNDILFHLIKPYYKSKDIVSDLINNLVNIVKDNKDNSLNSKENKVDSQEIFNENDGSLLKAKLNKNMMNKKQTVLRNPIKSKKMSQTQNYFYNKMLKETYKSPFYAPFKSHKVIENKNTKENMIDLSNTNSLLKFLSYQKKIQEPKRHYSLDNNILINEISKEIRELRNNFDKTLSNNQLKKYSHFKKGMSHSHFNNNKINFENKNDDKNIFSKTSIQYKNIKNMQNKVEKMNPKINIISLNNKNLEKLKNIISYSKISDKKNDKSLEKKLDEINERMYYKQINYKFGYKQIKELYKITEVAALNLAKKKKFDKIKLSLLK